MKICEVEEQVGISKKNIRFYEDKGLLTPKRNSENGYREYDESHVKELEEIKLFRKLGLPLEEIRNIKNSKTTISDSMARHLITVNREIENLKMAESYIRRIKETVPYMSKLNASEMLLEMEELEEKGTSFKDAFHKDIRAKSYLGATLAFASIVLIIIGIILFVYFSIKDTHVNQWILCLICLCIFMFIIPVLLVYIQRIREIRKGEEIDAKAY